MVCLTPIAQSIPRMITRLLQLDKHERHARGMSPPHLARERGALILRSAILQTDNAPCWDVATAR